MLRVILQNTTLKQNINNGLKKLRTLTTASPLEDIQNEHNHVKITGTIITNGKTLNNGFTSIIVRTNENNDKYYNHHVNVKTDDLLTVGQRIYIFGHLNSKPFTLDDGRLRQKLTIKSTYHRLRGESNTADNTHVKDQNNAKIVGKITSDIRITDKHVLLTIASRHNPKGDGTIPGIVITQFHRVIVYDPSVILVARNLQKFDRILVEGKVCYSAFKNTVEKTQHGGFITAQSIQRIEQ
ncbi:uncharacterized protein LOC116352516 [Contarinia nasturtii]|uniref:uncharacterized protein LOC116352516 n=1 Tax=Contarinia nasturtii TaxID=265458 RepID=UPI0012D3E05F|nr:uncharacterized protein LOC116352516 [Contarinia nasturtii]